MKAGEKSNALDLRFSEIGKIEKKEYDKLKRRTIKFKERNRWPEPEQGPSAGLAALN